MLKRTVVFLLAFLFQTGVGHAKPDLTEVKAFRIYNGGSQNGEAIFIMTSDREGIVSSPVAVESAAVLTDTGAISFGSFSFRAFGNTDSTVVIHDVWNDNKKGFRSVLRGEIGTETTIGYVKPVGRYDSRRSRSLSGKTSFRFYGLKGHVDIYNLSNGKHIESDIDNKFSRNGDLLFVITGPNSGRMYGNAGSSEVDVYRDDTSIVLLETTLSGSKQVTIVQKRWNTKHDGFECTHIRNTIGLNFLSGDTELIRSIFAGVAKPQ